MVGSFLIVVLFIISKALYDLATLKKKVKEKEDKKKKKLRVIKSEVEDLADSLSNADGIPAMSQDPSPIALSSVKEEWVLQRALGALCGWREQLRFLWDFCSLGCGKCVVCIFVYEGEYFLRELILLVFFNLKTSRRYEAMPWNKWNIFQLLFPAFGDPVSGRTCYSFCGKEPPTYLGNRGSYSYVIMIFTRPVLL